MGPQLPPSDDSKDNDERDDLVYIEMPEGEGDDMANEEEEEAAPIFKTRRAFFDHPDFSFSPDSLGGSYCLRIDNGETIWEGRVVGQITMTKYLIELTGTSLSGQKRQPVQIIFDVDRMELKDEGYEWRFYDSEETMRAGYAEYVAEMERVE